MKKSKESKTRKYQCIVSKLVYLEARRIAEKHSVFWSKIREIETKDPFAGDVLIEFRGKRDNDEFIRKDIDYILEYDEYIRTVYAEGKRQVVNS